MAVVRHHDWNVEIAELVLKYVEALVWPVATVALVWRLRHTIKKAIARLSRLETPAGTMEFAEEARDVREDSEEITEAAATGAQDMDLEPGMSAAEPVAREEFTRVVREQLRNQRWGIFAGAMDVADASPVGAVVTAWTTLEALCLRVARELGWPTGSERAEDGKIRVFTALGALHRLEVSHETLGIYRRLRRLRNAAVHDPGSVGGKAARDFVRSCQTVADAIQEAAPHAFSGTPGPP